MIRFVTILSLVFVHAMRVHASPSDSPGAAEVIFSASFEGSASAKTPTGTVEGVVTGTERYERGRFGKAIVAGDGGAVVAYPSTVFSALDEGSVELWLKPLNWDMNDPNFHLFIDKTGTDWLLLYKGPWKTIRLLMDSKAVNASRNFSDNPTFFGSDGWHHLVATWKGERAVVYVDGIAGSPGTVVPPVNLAAQVILVGDRTWDWDERQPPCQTLIDEFRIYRRALDAKDVAALFSHGRLPEPGEPPLVMVPIQSQPLAAAGIDWLRTPRISGFVEPVSASPTSNTMNYAPAAKEFQPAVHVTYDAERLHFLFQCPVGNGVTLSASRKERDSEVFRDDSLEIHLIPPGEPRRHLQFVSNSAGTIFDTLYDDKGKVHGDWNGDWQVATDLRDGVWRSEISISFASLGAAAPGGGADQEWRANFCRSIALVGGAQRNLSWVPGFLDTARFGRLILARHAPIVQMATVAVSEKSELNLDVAISAPATAFGDIAGRFSIASDQDVLLETERVLRMTGDSPVHFTQTGELPMGSNILTFQAWDGARLVSRLSVPLVSPPSNKSSFTILPSKGIGLFEMKMDKGVPADSCEVTLAKANGSAPLAAVSARCDAERKVSAEFALAKLEPGQYLIRAVAGQAATPLSEKTFTKPEAPWQGNTLGVLNDGEVPPPWTPLILTENGEGVSIDCWGRKLLFDQSLLPTSIVSQGQELLAAPVQLTVGNGNSTNVAWKPISIVKESAAMVILEGEGQAGDLSVKARTTVEFDGLIFVSLSFSSDGKDVAIRNLALDVPLVAAHVPYRQLPGFSMDDSALNEDKPGWKWEFGFLPYLWLGDDDRGLTWFCESSQGWSSPRNQRVVLSRDGNTLHCRFNIADGQPAGLDKLEFGLHPTPTRSRPARWREFGPIDTGKISLMWASETYTTHHGYPEAQGDGAAVRWFVDMTHKKKQLCVPYLHSSMLSNASKEWSYYQTEWEIPGKFFPTPDGCKDPIMNVCPAAPGWNDFTVWKIHGFVEKWGFDGVYHDFAAPMPCSNERHGCCSGRMPIMAWRDLYKRLYVMLKRLPKETFYIHHISVNSGGLCSPHLSFCDAFADSEQLAAKAETVTNKDFFIRTVPDHYYRIRGTGKQFGAVPINLNYTTNNFIRGDAGLQMLYDVPMVWAWFRDKTPMGTALYAELHKANLDFGIGENDVAHLPPWKSADVLVCDQPEFKIGVHLKGSSALVTILNTQAERADATPRTTITLHPAGTASFAQAWDALSKECFEVTDGKSISIEVPSLDFRLVRVELRK